MGKYRSGLIVAAIAAILSAAGFTAQAAPTPRKGILNEDFLFSQILTIAQRTVDSIAPSDEGIRRMLTTNFAWGGYTPATSGATFGIVMGKVAPGTPSTDVARLSFHAESRAVGAYAYTRFDNDASDSNNNVPNDALDMTDSGAKAVVRTVQNGNTDLALLLRAGGSWWRSSSKTLAATADWTTTATPIDTTFAFAGGGAVTWNAVTSPTDLEQVDAGGETALTIGGAGSPNFSNVDGVGVMVTAVSGAVNDPTGLTIVNLRLEAPPIPTAAHHWTQYD